MNENIFVVVEKIFSARNLIVQFLDLSLNFDEKNLLSC
jgi:hypothetical protein